jgi:hypothetical protein
VAAAVVCSLVVVVPVWWETDIVFYPFSLTVGAVTALVVGVVAGARAMLEPMGATWARGAAVLLASTAWLGGTGPRYLGAWQAPIILAGLVAIVAVAAVWAALRARAGAAPPDAPA